VNKKLKATLNVSGWLHAGDWQATLQSNEGLYIMEASPLCVGLRQNTQNETDNAISHMDHFATEYHLSPLQIRNTIN
jgi:hypothetical protein